MIGQNDRSDENVLEPTRTTAGSGLKSGPTAHVQIGRCIGSYKILKVLGEGGMGVVYLAEQDQPRRTVALKLIPSGVTKPELLKRFEHEEQILGRLQHPGIAQIYEAGTADTGSGSQPYFAMELVSGLPLTRYADQKRLGTRNRLELIAKICDAVQHAHQKGIIHRDLKPGNILVAGDGQPKILDFGVARATDADIQTTSTTLQTDMGRLIGTIPYMSPEQAAGDPEGLDTRSDVYALGVVAYELLTGRLPYDIRHKMIPEAVRLIREEEPKRLSSVKRTLRGDVQTIILKALEKDKSRRYQSASDLANDIRHYLTDEPIIARPPSAAYQLRKFAKRNVALVSGVAAAFVVLVLGVIGTSIGLARAVAAREAQATQRQIAESERDRAVEAEGRAESEAQKARTQAAIAEAVIAFLKDDLLAKANPYNEPDRTIKLREVLDRAAERIEGRFDDQPLVEATIRSSLGVTLNSLGEFSAAEPHLERARDLRRRVLGDEHPDTLSSMDDLALLYQGQGRWDEAESLYRQTLDVRRRIHGAEHPETLSSVNNLAELYISHGRSDQAEPLCISAVNLARRVLGDEQFQTRRSINNLATAYYEQGRYDEAEPLYREVIELHRRVLGDEHPDTLVPVGNLAVLYKEQGRYDEAEPLYIETCEVHRRVLGDEHPDTLISENNLAGLYRSQARYEEAEALYAQAAVKARRSLAEGHWLTGVFRGHQGAMLSKLEQYGEAEDSLLEAHGILSVALGPQHKRTIAVMESLVALYEARGTPDKAAQWRAKLHTVGAAGEGPPPPEGHVSTQPSSSKQSEPPDTQPAPQGE